MDIAYLIGYLFGVEAIVFVFYLLVKKIVFFVKNKTKQPI